MALVPVRWLSPEARQVLPEWALQAAPVYPLEPRARPSLTAQASLRFRTSPAAAFSRPQAYP